MTINDRLTGITTFVRVVEAGNFALAAERLHLTRSAVGKSIARLEQRLGVLLFHRNPRGLNLTLGARLTTTAVCAH
ncbi:HTH-type transcriptional regulator TfdS [compost metagenome]